VVVSSAFEAGRPIPREYTADGRDVSPPLSWSGVPKGAKELALIVDDPDAPSEEPWVHWVIYGLPPYLAGFSAGIAADATLAEPAGAKQGSNSWGTVGYRGAAPPAGDGPHHYHFKLYALGAKLDLPPGADKKALLAAMKGRTLAVGELIGTYDR